MVKSFNDLKTNEKGTLVGAINEVVGQVNNLAVNVKSFGAKGDGVADDWTAINNSIEYLKSIGGGILLIPYGTFRVTRTVRIKSRNITVLGTGIGSEILYDGSVYKSENGQEGIGVIHTGRDINELSGGNYNDVVIKDVTINGGLKALWGIYANYNSYGFRLEGVNIRRAVGFIHTQHCYKAIYNNIRMEYNNPSLPSGMSLSDWNTVHDNALFYNNEANHADFYSVYFQGFGMSTIPTGGTVTKALIRLHGTSIKMSNVALENSWRTMNNNVISGTPSVEYIFDVVNNNISIDNFHMEDVDVLGILCSKNMGNHNISIKNIFINNSYIYGHPIWIKHGRNVSVENFFVYGTELNNGNSYRFVHTEVGDCSIKSPILWHENKGDRVTIDGYAYADPKIAGKLGIPATNGTILSDGCTLPRIVNGFEVFAGKDDISPYVAVKTGAIVNQEGIQVKLGVHSAHGETGWILRTSATAKSVNYNVYIDVKGGVFLENPLYERTPSNSGKILIATFSLDSSGSIVNFSAIDNTFKGTVINNGNNKTVYVTSLPNTGYWKIGDAAYNLIPIKGGKMGWVRLTNGTGNVLGVDWQPFGGIDT